MPFSADNTLIRSYVRRKGRITRAQQRALHDYADRYLITRDCFTAPADEAAWASFFDRQAPLVVEIGSGYGEATAAMAAAGGDRNYIAFEVHQPGIGALMNRLARDDIANVRIVPADALETIGSVFTAATVSAFNIFFPDPWRKRKHHKRRLLRPAVLSLLLAKLRPGGNVHFVTDWQHYAQTAARVFAAAPALAPARPPPHPPTAYEQRARRAGREIYELFFTYQPSAADSAASSPARMKPSKSPSSTARGLPDS